MNIQHGKLIIAAVFVTALITVPLSGCFALPPPEAEAYNVQPAAPPASAGATETGQAAEEDEVGFETAQKGSAGSTGKEYIQDGIQSLSPDDLISNVTASSYLNSMYDPGTAQMAEYSPSNVIDGKNETAWVEGADGDGTGEWIRIDFTEPVRLSGAYIKNGYWKSEARLNQNHRLKHILVEFSDGSTEESYLADPAIRDFSSMIQGEGEKIVFDAPRVTTYIRFVILDTYSGTDGEDTCVSGIKLFQ